MFDHFGSLGNRFGHKKVDRKRIVMEVATVCFTDLDPGSEMIFFRVNFDHFYSDRHF